MQGDDTVATHSVDEIFHVFTTLGVGGVVPIIAVAILNGKLYKRRLSDGEVHHHG